MKRLIRKKWLRRSTQTVVIVASLLGLASAAANRRAAGAKRDALEGLKSGGNLVEAAKFRVEMPPDDENFAMIPLLVKLREEAKLRIPTNYRRLDEIPDDQADESVGDKLVRLGLDAKGSMISRPRLGEPLSLAVLGEKLRLTGSAAEMLDQFDRRHAEVLGALREGMGRRWAVMPSNINLADPEKTYNISRRDIWNLSPAATGLALRAGLALEAGKGEVALESLLINRRLSDLLMSDVMAVGHLAGWQIDRRSMPPLFRGISSGAWDADSLARLREAWSGRDTKEVIGRSLNLEGVAMAIYCDHWKRDRRLGSAILGEKDGFLTQLRQGATPGFWFDAHSADILHKTAASLDLVRLDQPLQSWWVAPASTDDPGATQIKGLDSPYARPTGLLEKICDVHSPDFNSLISAVMKNGSKAIVDDSLARLACLLAEYKLAHGAYPPTLESIGGADVIDPLTGKPFLYRVEGTEFRLYSPGPNGVDEGCTGKPRAYFGTPAQLDWGW